MSLVNDMLNDLEERQNSNSSKPELDVVPVGHGTLAEKKNRLIPFLVVALILVVASLSYFLWSKKEIPEIIEDPVEVQRAIVQAVHKEKMNSLSLQNYENKDGYHLVFSAHDLVYEISPVNRNGLQLRIENVVWNSEKVLLPDWLSEVRTLKNNNDVVISIVGKTPVNYQAQLIDEGDSKKLDILLIKDKPEAVEKTTSLPATSDKSKKVAIAQKEKVKVQPSREKRTATKQVKTPVALTPEQLDRKTSIEAQQLIRRGQYQQAEQKLWRIVDGYSAAKDSRITLITLLLGQKRHQLAEQQLKIGLQVYPKGRDLLKLQARILMAQGKLEDARKTLSAMPVNLSVDSEQMDLLAVTTQGLGDHQKALEYYHQLVRFDAQIPQWWVGLGVSMEALGRTSSARSAYLRASRLPINNSALKDYVAQRLAIIPADDSE